MNSSFTRALALFNDYVEMSASERASALARLQESSPETHDALCVLLASDDALAGKEHASDSSTAADHHEETDLTKGDTRIGRRLGPWRITGILGVGGMGTVYEAHRDDGHYQLRVALKCIRSELASERLFQSFRTERELLANLEHPNIVRLLDAGLDDNGNPWFAMRYVEGVPLDEWCDTHGSSLRTRVELLVTACEATAYAHQRLVLHLDIKPSNLLVNPQGQLQLLDFGLAASLAQMEHAPRIAVSMGYTAPEAMCGAPPSVAMDTWSLGMVMYRLLCGRLPALPKPRLAETRSATIDVATSMSELAGNTHESLARQRGIPNPRLLSRRLAGDLDAIALRCIACSPDRRYHAVMDLADDLRRWLESRPVDARNGGFAYRTSRFITRYRLVAALAATTLLAVGVGGGLTLWHVQRASKEAESVAAISRIFEETLGTATLSGLGRVPLSSNALLESTETRVRALSLEDQPRVLARGLSVLARNYATTGNYAHAVALAEEAASLQGDDPLSFATNQATLASLLNLQGRHSDALRVAEKALAETKDFNDPSQRLQLMVEAARSQWNMAARDRARKTLGDAFSLAAQADDAASQAELLTLRGYWNTRLYNFREADADLRRAISLAMPDAPLVANEARLVAAQSLLEQERGEEARQLLEAAYADYRARLGESHPQTGSALAALANAQCHTSLLEACEASLQQADRIILARYGEQHPERANSLRIHSTLRTFQGAPAAENIGYLRRSEAIYSAFYPPTHEHVQRAQRLLARRLLLAAAGLSLKEKERNRNEAIALYEGILERADGSLPLHPQINLTLANALAQRAGRGDHARAKRLIEANRAVIARFPDGSYTRFLNEYMLVRLHFIERDLAGAEALVESLIGTLGDHQTSANNRTMLGSAFVLRAAIAQERADRQQTRAWLVRAHDHALATSGPQGGLTRASAVWLEDVDARGRFEPPNE